MLYSLFIDRLYNIILYEHTMSQKISLFIAIITSTVFISVFAKAPVKFTEKEKYVLRREMIELDINLRSLISLLALNYYDSTVPVLKMMTSYKTRQSPKYKKTMDKVIQKLKKKNLTKYFYRIHKNAKILLNKNKRIRRQKDPYKGWADKNMTNIVRACQSCHQQFNLRYKK